MQLNCPMPNFGFDRITMGHGSGGQLSHQLLETGVFDLLSNPLLDQKHDGAIFEMSGRLAMSTDSFVVSPIFFPGGNIGDLAVNGTVNDLAMCGAVPKYLSLGFIIEEGLPMQEFWDVLVAIKTAAQNARVDIVTGDTKVVERGSGDKIFINTTGIGQVLPSAKIDAKRIELGDKVLVSGPLAAHGIAIMSLRQGLGFETQIQSDTAALNFMANALIEDFGEDIKLLRDPTRGGLGTVLNEISGDTHMGIQLQDQAIPVAEEVRSACDLLGYDPLYVANEGLLVAIVSADAAEAAVERMRNYPEGKEAAIIGETVLGHPGKVVLHSGLGGKRVVHMLHGEQLPRIC